MRLFPALACLLAISTAPAAADDRRPRPAPPAVETLRDCPGGFVLPGSSGCVRLSGSVEVSTTLRLGHRAAAASPHSRERLFSRTEGRVAADVRIPTELGPVRAYTSLRLAEPGLRPGER